MMLALVAILAVLTGLVVRQNGLDVVACSSPVHREAGMRAAGLGALISLISAPWLFIGLAAHVI